MKNLKTTNKNQVVAIKNGVATTYDAATGIYRWCNTDLPDCTVNLSLTSLDSWAPCGADLRNRSGG